MSLRRSLAWTMLGQSLYFVIQYGGSIAVARLLSPAEMGVFAIALSAIGLLSLLQSMGLQNFVIRDEHFSPERFGTAIAVNAGMSLLLAALILAAAGPVGAYMRDDAVTQAMTALALAPLIGMLEFPSGALLQRHKRFKAYAAVQVARAMVATSLTVLGAYVGLSSMSLVYGTLLGNTTSLVLLLVIANPLSHFRWSLQAWRDVFRFGSRMLMIGGMMGVAGRVPDFVLGRVLGLAALGIYGRASSTLGIVWENLYMGASRVLVPSMADVHRAGSSLRPLYLRTLMLMTGIFWPAFGGLAIMSGPLIYMVYGPKWLAAAPVLTLLSIAVIIQVAMTMTWEVFVVRGEVNRQAKLEIWRALSLVATFAIGAHFGLAWAAASRILDSFIAIALYAPHMLRMTESRPRDFLLAYARSAPLLLAACVPPALLMQQYGWQPDVPVPVALACIASSIFSWLICAALLDHPVYQELRIIARSAHSWLSRAA